MIYKAYSQLTQELLRLPESGMGYQFIEARRPNKSYRDRFIVYNSELIVDYNNYFSDYKDKILNEGYERVLDRSILVNLWNPRLVSTSELRNPRMMAEGKMSDKGRHSGGKGASENDPIYANGEDIFVRLSAYENDRRVDFENKRLKSGTYTTTEEDYLTCKHYNDDPVDRYALPNNEKIKWAFHVLPKSIDQYRPGIVQPANGHDGGGIEALFDDGTSNNTLLKKAAY